MATKNQIKALKSSAHEIRLDNLRNVGYTDGHRVIQSKLQKANDPKRQRKNKSWMREN